jgi:hypothetical protein
MLGSIVYNVIDKINKYLSYAIDPVGKFVNVFD